MNDLVLCPSCTRHVRRTEEQCPFCGTVLSAELRGRRPPSAPPGLSRARLYAFHAAVATSVAAGACGGVTTTPGDAGNAIDARTDDARTSSDASQDGAPATGDGSSTADAAADRSIVDAGADRDGWGPPPPPYGCVFPEGCGDVKV